MILAEIRDRPKLLFTNSAETETGPKYSDVVLAENETEAEFNILFRLKPKSKINNAECITYVSATINKHRESGEVRRMVTEICGWTDRKTDNTVPRAPPRGGGEVIIARPGPAAL